jgi:S-DNA-T family DNA segregation ATPase FtsK/SpoIIIE
MADQGIDLRLDERVQAYEPGSPSAPDDPIGVHLDDAETVVVVPATQGVPVDPPVRLATFADIVSRADERRPIVPASLRNRAGRHALITLVVAIATHEALWQLSRVPLYLGRMLLWLPNGLRLALWRPVRWASAEDGNYHLRQNAANRGDADTWLSLDARRMRQAKPRWTLLGIAALALAVGVLVTRALAPAWAQALAGAGVLMGLARLGRPQDHPILERAFNASKFVRLTAELTRKALVTCGAGIKDPAGVKFNREIYRDGPGYTAEVSLPDGVIATDVIDRRDYLAAGFQLPIAQVWPDPVRGAHPGVLAVWVADRPVDRIKQPASPLLTAGALDFWGALPYGDDVRMRPVSWRLDERNSLFAGMPGTGKTLAARNIALGAAMDPLVRFGISELKGSGDLDPMEPLCGRGMYVSGADDRSKERTLELLRWLIEECERRPPQIRKWAAKGLNSQNKLNRAIAEADESLFPFVGFFDEIQELITDPEHGKEAKALLTSLVKRGRSLGIHLILATQRIDKESVPKGISSNISNRLCLGVQSHVETDLVLGTGAYKAGARPTAFMPPADGDNPWAGWGCIAGRQQPVRASYLDNNATAEVVQRALALRGDTRAVDLADRPDRDVLADVIRVFAHLNRPGIQWQQLAELLARAQPELYAGVTAEAVSAQVRAEGVPSVDVKSDGVALKGCRRDAVEAAIQRRSIGG